MVDLIGQARSLTADLDPENRLFDDAQVQAYLDLNGGVVRLAAADMLDAVAVSEVLTSKVIRTQDLTTDGAKVSAELRARARDLRAQHRDAVDADAEGVFTTARVGDRPGPPELTERQVWGL